MGRESQPAEQRLNYHVLRESQAKLRARRVEGRLRAVRNIVDLRGKTVLDLGCSGGAFSIGVASEAEWVLGVDADPLVLRRAREEVTLRGLENVSFRRGVISPTLIETLPRVDVTLFLSVFHHMLTASEAYAWNSEERIDAWSSLERIKANTNTLVFEMGLPDEGYEWCERLPEMRPDPVTWIRERVIGDEFEWVERIDGPDRTGYWKGVHRLARSLAALHPLLERGAKRLLRYDVRDERPVFIASRGGESHSA